MDSSRSESLIGVVLDQRYRILRIMASGGMGAVYEAEQLGLGRRVALKVMHEALSRDPAALERFEREAQVVAALGHPNIAQVFDFHRGPSAPAWIAMELVPGVSLSHVLATDGALAPARVVALLLPLLGALEAAHAAGVVHRDIKAGNVMVTSAEGHGELPKLLDFGIAKLAAGTGAERLTAVGQVLGTPTTMSPEQALGEPVDARTDIYAMGLLTFAMVTGTPAFRRGELGEVVQAILAGLPRKPSDVRPGIPLAFDAFVARATARRPEDRFPSVPEMATAARTLLSTPDAAPLSAGPRVSEKPTRAAPVPREPPTRVAPAAPEPPTIPDTRVVSAPPHRRLAAWLLLPPVALALAVVVAAGVATGLFAIYRHDAVAPALPAALSTSTLRPFIAAAQARVPAGARLIAIEGICLDRRGRIASMDADCGWTLTFDASERWLDVEYSLRKPSGLVTPRARGAPALTLPSTVPDSDAVMAAFLLSPGCEAFEPGAKETTLDYRTPGSVEVNFGKDRTRWRAATTPTGSLGPVLEQCVH